MAIAEVLGVKPEQVTFHTEMAGGGFDRRATPDSHVQREAATTAKRLRGTPVKLIWTREGDVQGGYYRPMHVHRVEIGIGADGMPAAAWRHVIVGQSILAGTPFAPMMVKNARKAAAFSRAKSVFLSRRFSPFGLTVNEEQIPQIIENGKNQGVR